MRGTLICMLTALPLLLTLNGCSPSESGALKCFSDSDCPPICICDNVELDLLGFCRPSQTSGQRVVGLATRRRHAPRARHARSLTTHSTTPFCSRVCLIQERVGTVAAAEARLHRPWSHRSPAPNPAIW